MEVKLGQTMWGRGKQALSSAQPGSAAGGKSCNCLIAAIKPLNHLACLESNQRRSLAVA